MPASHTHARPAARHADHGSVYNGINQAYMAGLMATAMVVIELFLRSMIPHHSGAILDLCKTIVAGQAAEIRQMKAILAELAQ